jgi:hypothetical protein
MKALLVFVSFCSLVVAIAVPSWGREAVWYDANKQALAVDPYFDGFGGTIYIDFNADHMSGAGIIGQTGWHYQFGNCTDVGLYSIGGNYGWGERLGDINPVAPYENFVRTIYSGAEAVDQFYYFTDEWNVTTGKTILYVRPATSTASIPVTEEMLYNTYYSFNWGPWKRLMTLPEPDPIEAVVSVNPLTLNAKSRGKWVTAYIELLSPNSTSQVDLSTVALAVMSDKKVGGVLTQTISIAGPVELADADGDGILDLVAKFDRSDLLARLQDGEARVNITGKLTDGTPFAGNATFTVIH